ncbi:hypothetical protein COLO4_37856 [Corchorus olitorius]|uniref:Uncharacterized protein n=1 Tax=Corchorus olitorius TaxID=93759 RepID=A0A1R3FYT3_9ROSI|nr:hypothetical protein COLO4_37856 [Corchorus olitorius]
MERTFWFFEWERPGIFFELLAFGMRSILGCWQQRPLCAPRKENEKLRSKHDLIANIAHDGKPDEGFYKVFVLPKNNKK